MKRRVWDGTRTLVCESCSAEREARRGDHEPRCVLCGARMRAPKAEVRRQKAEGTATANGNNGAHHEGHEGHEGDGNGGAEVTATPKTATANGNDGGGTTATPPAPPHRQLTTDAPTEIRPLDWVGERR